MEENMTPLTTEILKEAESNKEKMAELFRRFSTLDVTEHIEQKNGLSYLSWAWAVSAARKFCPDFTFEIKMFDGFPYQLDPKTGYMVWTSVTMNGFTIPMWLPVMDSSNKAMKDTPYTYKVYNKFKKTEETKTVEAATMFDINKTIMRCLVKNFAMFGLGLHIYAGEDLPETVESYDSTGKTIEPIIEEIVGVAKEKKATLNRLGKEAGFDANWGTNVVCNALVDVCGTKNPNNIKSIPVAEKTLKKLNALDVNECVQNEKDKNKESKGE